MKENLTTKTEDINHKIIELVSKVRSYNPNVNVKLIDKAVRFSYDKLSNKKRLSGEDFFSYSFEVANMLADLKLGSHTIAAGLLSSVLDEANVKPELISQEFDDEILSIIQALSRLKNVDKNLNPEAEEERRAENIRRIMLASSKDLRVIIIKLVERLQSVRSLKYLPSDTQKLIAKETMTIYAPIAHKLGMYTIKAELEDLSFRHLETKKYLELKSRVAKKKAERESEIGKIISTVTEMLKHHNISATVDGRAKHFYSIYKKIISENKKFDEIYDLMAIRIIVNSVDECYKALGLVHQKWKPMPERLKDYIAVPKSNGYQSLHTGVFIGHGSILEVQIRSKEMHAAAEGGIAAHWRYKGDERDKKFDRHVSIMKQMLDWQRYSVDARDFIESLKIDLFEKEIFVFTPKGDPIALVENATVVDFAYAVHTDIGNHCKQAKVNGAIVPLDYVLSPGDVVEILTQKNAVPSRSWISIAKSPHTRAKIRNALNMDVDTKLKKLDPSEISVDTDFPEDIVIQGKKYDLKIPRCCTPRKADSNRAFKTKDGKIVVHKVDCPNVYTCDLSKEVKLSELKSEIETEPLRIDVQDKNNILSDVLNFIAREKYLVNSVNTRVGRDGRLILKVDIKKDPKNNIHNLVNKLKKSNAVINVFIEDEYHTNRYFRTEHNK